MGAKERQAKKAGGRARLGLILFGSLFLLLFVGLAIGQGLTGPSVPSGDVALVEDVPEELGAITRERFDRALVLQAAESKLKEVPKPGDDNYEEVKKGALEEILNAVWLQGQAEELGIAVSDSQVEKELEKIKKQSFPTPQAYKKFLEESKFTQAEVDERVKLQVLTTQIQEKVSEEAPKPTSAEVEEAYEAEKDSKYTTKESRDVRLIASEDKADVEAAKEALEKDNSPGSWRKVAAKYSSDPSTNQKGGLQPGVQEEFLPNQLKAPIFDAENGELVGPIKVEKNYLLVEIVKGNTAKTKPLKEVESEVLTGLEQKRQQDFFSEFVNGFQRRWESRTFCADDYAIEMCSNYVGSGHPANAPAACYEEDPEEPANECPAPVIQTQPALPGTVSPEKPEGEKFVQRPRPPSGAEQGTVVPEGAPAGAPEGAPEGAEEAPPAGE